MAKFELRLYQRNGCGAALLGDVSLIEAADEAAAASQARRRVAELPRHCAGALFDAQGAEIWAGDAPTAR